MSRNSLLIEGLGSNGDGCAALAGKPVYVPYALPGEVVAVETDRAELIGEAAADRVIPVCPHHGNLLIPDTCFLTSACGGCRMQHLADPAYRDWKRGLVVYALRHLGIAPEIIGPLQVSKPNSRRRASFSALRRQGKTVLGFRQRGTHSIVDMQVCFVLLPAILALVEPLRALPILREGEGASYLVTYLDSALELLIERKRPLELAERELLAEFATAHDLARLAWRATARDVAEPVAYRQPLVAKFGDAAVPLPAGAFLQATLEGEAALVAAVLAGLPPGPVIDLFAGCGTFSFPAAARGPVTAYEGNRDAVAAINAARQPAVKALHRNLFSDPVTAGELAGFTAAIFDPPYAGAVSQVAELAQSQLATIIGVSCNPQSFARDAAVLIAGGYRLVSVTPVDQFLWSADVELAGVFKLNKFK